MSAVGDLTTLASVKAWRTPPVATTSDDAAVSREITAASRAVLKHIDRKSLAFASYVETRNGQGTTGMRLRNYPVVAVASVSVCGQAIQPQPPPGSTTYGCGFVVDYEEGFVYLNGGFFFPLGQQNCTFAYTAGLLNLDAPLTMDDATYQIQCSSLSELWCTDAGVVYDGTTTPLVPVKAGPAQGQYVAPLGPDGFYQFNSADSGSAMDVSYGYTPRDVEEAVIQAVILEYNRRGRIGENSKVLAGENVTYYTSKAFTETTLSRLRNYVNVVPNP